MLGFTEKFCFSLDFSIHMIIIFYKETSYRYGLIFYIKKKTGIWEAPVLDLILSDLANVRVFAESPLDKSHLSNPS